MSYQVLDLIIKSIGLVILSLMVPSVKDREISDSELGDDTSFTLSIPSEEIAEVECEIVFKDTVVGPIFHSYSESLTNSNNKVSILVNAVSRVDKINEKKDFQFIYNAEKIDYLVKCKFLKEPLEEQQPLVIKEKAISLRSSRSFKNLFK